MFCPNDSCVFSCEIALGGAAQPGYRPGNIHVRLIQVVSTLLPQTLLNGLRSLSLESKVGKWWAWLKAVPVSHQPNRLRCFQGDHQSDHSLKQPVTGTMCHFDWGSPPIPLFAPPGLGWLCSLPDPILVTGQAHIHEV